MDYKKQLKTKQWKDKRAIIKKRDKNQCTKCKSKKCLQVHHLYYTKGKMAWEYPDEALVTLCEVCHKLEHGITDDTFYNTNSKLFTILTQLSSFELLLFSKIINNKEFTLNVEVKSILANELSVTIESIDYSINNMIKLGLLVVKVGKYKFNYLS